MLCDIRNTNDYIRDQILENYNSAKKRLLKENLQYIVTSKTTLEIAIIGDKQSAKINDSEETQVLFWIEFKYENLITD